MQKQQFILQGNGSLYNRGCEAILRSTADILRSEFEDCSFINAPWNSLHPPDFDDMEADFEHVLPNPPERMTPKWFIQRLKWKLFRRTSYQYEKYLSKAAAVLAIGGDNYSLDYGIPWLKFWAHDAVFRKGCPLVIWGASVGPFTKNPEFENFAIQELKKVSLICARESETVSYLASMGIEENVRAVSDPAFALNTEPVADSSELVDFLDAPCLGVNISPLIGLYLDKDVSLEQMAAEKVLDLLKKFDMPIVLIPHVMHGKNNDDYALLDAIRKKLHKYSDRIFLVDRHYNACQLKWIISKLKAFIGARTHATIAAFSSNVPTVSIGYSVKAKGINKDIFGHCDYLVPLEKLNSDMLNQTTLNVLNNSDQISASLQSVMPDYIKRSYLAGRYLRETIEKSH